MRQAALFLSLILLAAPAFTHEAVWLGAPMRLKAKVYRSADAGSQPLLIVVLHGDAPNAPPTYQYRFAERAAKRLGNVVVAAVLRPGYSDGEGQSDGVRGKTTGDNYTPKALVAITSAIEQLKARYQPRRVLLVGHSGGAALSANLLGQRAAGIGAAVLVSCPCDLPAWRRHMGSVQRAPIWDEPVSSLSPLDLVGDMSPSAHVWMIVGANDNVTPPWLTETYAGAIRRRNIAVEITVVPGLEHNILLEPVVLDLVTRAAAN